jgi:hypothetical protein
LDRSALDDRHGPPPRRYWEQEGSQESSLAVNRMNVTGTEIWKTLTGEFANLDLTLARKSKGDNSVSLRLGLFGSYCFTF